MATICDYYDLSSDIMACICESLLKQYLDVLKEDLSTRILSMAKSVIENSTMKSP